jgi:hypothetical protein
LLKVEVHSPYTLEDCARDLNRAGFATRIDHRRSECMVAYSTTIADELSSSSGQAIAAESGLT